MVTFIGILFIIVCLLLIGVVLLQKGRGGGLSGAFGGAGASSAFGTRTGDVFTWVTIVLTGLFLVLAVTEAMLISGTVVKEKLDMPVFGSPMVEDTGHRLTISKPKDATDIYYTTDGSEPTKDNGKKYKTTAVPVNWGQTIKARAYGGSLTKASDVAEKTVAKPVLEAKPDADKGKEKPAAKEAPKPAETKPAKPAEAKPATKPAATPKPKKIAIPASKPAEPAPAK